MSTHSFPVRVDFPVPVDHPAFEGHFPGAPILPGVALLDEVLRVATLGQVAKLGQVATPSQVAARGEWRIASAKFLSPVTPGETLTLELQPQPNGALRFSIHCSTRAVASGTVAPPPPAGESSDGHPTV
jgi:3-hydroxymyristoyl/3-hydroxydecanoyl-(acyl carrier protein) dehydratase